MKKVFSPALRTIRESPTSPEGIRIPKTFDP